MSHAVAKWACDICDRIYDTALEAESCEEGGIRDFKDPPAVGDYVLCGSWGWYDHPERGWNVERPGDPKAADRMLIYKPVWRVVHKEMVADTHITPSRHTVEYLLYCANPPSAELAFATTSSDHYPVEKCAPPKDESPTPPLPHPVSAKDWHHHYVMV